MFFNFWLLTFARKIMDLPEVSGKWRESAAAPRLPGSYAHAAAYADPRLCQSLLALKRRLRNAWKSIISLSTLQNLISSMPND